MPLSLVVLCGLKHAAKRSETDAVQMWRDKKKRDRVYGPADRVQAADNGMKGMTEVENKHFR